MDLCRQIAWLIWKQASSHWIRCSWQAGYSKWLLAYGKDPNQSLCVLFVSLPCSFVWVSLRVIRVRTKTSCWWEAPHWAVGPFSLPSLISAYCQIECTSFGFKCSFVSKNVPLLSCLMLMVLRKLTIIFLYGLIFLLLFFSPPRVKKKERKKKCKID